jgi:hypothetical protein
MMNDYNPEDKTETTEDQEELSNHYAGLKSEQQTYTNVASSERARNFLALQQKS